MCFAEKLKLRCRCYPERLAAIVLVEQQQDYVAEIGFEPLLDLKPCSLPPEMTWRLVKSVNHYDKTLRLGGKIIPIHPLVRKLLGIPKGKLKVETDLNYTEKMKKFKFKKRGETQTRLVPLDDVKEKLESLQGEVNKEEFCISYMLLALGYYLAPNTTNCVASRFFGVLEDISKIKDYDWCTLVADCLITSIKAYNETSTDFVGGCVHILYVSYSLLLI